MKLSRNFLIYDVDSGILNIIKTNNNFKKRPPKNFEKFEYHKIKEDMYLITFKWIDKIKVSDKYSKPNYNEVQSIFFESIGRLAVFCNSESNMHYFCGKIRNNYKINLKRIEYYDLWKKNFLNNKLEDGIVSYEIRNPKLSDSEENFERFSGEKMQLNHLKFLLLEKEESIISITLSLNESNLIYYVDPCSVIALSNNINESKLYWIIKLICERYKV